ncbi:CpsB/CapC family capsule biosynthesis tyrosine phosphatase [Mesorhizobium ciceri]|uniref:tyrosine-protein phosphatase n=1 Tax=Mesorhizobium ciceri TaxID=39645 RepID=UPI0007A946BA|nr:CpsB/CapC family capsule biosynthesis tyrosine phosphatase [Mesorhizobium ciceri]AMY00685.1 capsular biosynthesis protein [Mesorhizobium ciceri biovar biserrulae]
MIDLHSHILPGLDDGSPNIAESLEMAKLAVADGTTHMACTPHVVPGMYENGTENIVGAVRSLEQALRRAEIPLALYVGADIHIAPDLPGQLRHGKVPTLNRSRYFLFEPPHHVLPPRLEELALRLVQAGFVPILTHPERLTWIKANYDVVERLNRLGCLIQLTADSIIGAFGRTALYYSEKLIDEGRVDIIASDTHGANRRRPGLSQAVDAAAKRCGEDEAYNMVVGRPSDILANRPLEPVGKRFANKPSPDKVGRFGGLGRLLKAVSS